MFDYILGGLQVADISFAGVPDLVGWYQPSGVFALGVESFNGFVYVSDGLGVIQIYRNLLVTPVSVEKEDITISDFKLEQNYPNPFNPSTKIRYTIPNVIAIRQLPEKQSQFVSLKVYDILGNEVATLVNEEKPAGSYEVEFKASNLPSGTYFYQLKVDSFIETKKMSLIK